MKPPDVRAAGKPALVERLRSDDLFLSVEVRPPRRALARAQGIDAWIDTYHAIRRLTRKGVQVFVTDRAVGSDEEESLRHLVANLGSDADRSLISPILTAKHSLEYCLAFPGRALEHGFSSLVVLGGDRQDDTPRCVAHAWELRRRIRERFPRLVLGGWANPHNVPLRQVGFILQKEYCADFYLTQVVSHYDLRPVRTFMEAARVHGVKIPGVFGVFYYRSANARTLESLSRFLSVPASELTRDFTEKKLDADTLCARTLQALWDLGARNFYISNLDVRDAGRRLASIASRLDLKA
jgi:5,10-methylenetetrahydrofolate reductase